MIEKAENRNDPDFGLERFANDELVGDSDDDIDEESIDDKDYEEEKPRNPFKKAKEPKKVV